MTREKLFLITCLLILGSCKERKKGVVNLASMIQPISESNFFKEDNYSVWDGNLFKENDTYYLIYSRWNKDTGDWLITSEVCIAESKNLTGPYKYKKTILKGRGENYWDELNAHNPKLKKYEGRYYLYYISSKSGETRSHIRDSQRTGVAVSDNIFGPYERFDDPIVNPEYPVNNITVNPGVTISHDGKFYMILKGDKVKKEPHEKMGQRVQGIAISEKASGPFEIQPRLAVEGIDTEDASLWYDQEREMYYAIFHAHEFLGLIESQDGINWIKATNHKVMNKTIKKTDGSIRELNCIERPFVYFENNEPKAICISVRQGATYNTGSILIIPLK